MKVSELIKELQGMDGDAEVVLSSDAEGNSYHLARNIDECAFDPEYGEIREIPPDAETLANEPEDYAVPGQGRYILAVVLWP